MSASADLHVEKVRENYDTRVDQWQTIYDGESFHDHVIQRRMDRCLEAVDTLGPVSGKPLSEESRRALDVGCGAGQMALALAQRGYEVSAVDVSEGMIEATTATFEAAGATADIQLADMRHLPYEDDTFDWVSGLGAIEYLTDPGEAVEEFARVLVPGGHMVVTSPNPYRLAFALDPIGVAIGLLGPPPTGYPRQYLSASTLRGLAERAGVEVVGLLGHGIGPLQVAKKPLLPARTSIKLSHSAERSLPLSWLEKLGANMIMVARKPG
ncbi:class I SAM-dependent methyltransferase [Euzebya tangerina]|uniref:class I SAM-dependent methyltransferase n=1 Tax=Euzebya tangerina TaxID=591198 RepID=UPI000E3129C2|nr:class I SAM-dependent methyltransferase [Euzebya tangerina]